MGAGIRFFMAVLMNVSLTIALVAWLWFETKELGLIPALVLPIFFWGIILLYRFVACACCSRKQMLEAAAQGETTYVEKNANKIRRYKVTTSEPKPTALHYILLLLMCAPYVGLVASLFVSVPERAGESVYLTREVCCCPVDHDFYGVDSYLFEHHIEAYDS